MIKFFRKIRQTLLAENKFSKYLLYAIGEIILVVIGIVIALQINNWNEKRKQRQVEIVILLELKNELENDLNTEFIPGIKYLNESNQRANKLREVFKKNIIIPKDSIRNYFSAALGSWNFVLNLGAFENLKSTGINIISNDSLRSKISTIYSTEYPEIKNRTNKVINLVDNELTPLLSDNVAVYKSELSNKDYDFFINNKKFGNRIFHVHSERKLLLTRLNEIQPKVEILIKEINKEIERIER